MKNFINEIPPILEGIAGLSTSDLRGLAGLNAVQRGWGYFNENRLFCFSWEKTRKLKATVIGSRSYQVQIVFQSPQNFSSSCSCPAWNPMEQCKHVVCMLLTMRHIFQTPRYALKAYYHALTGQLVDSPNVPLTQRPSAPETVTNFQPMQIHLKRGDKGEIELEFRMGQAVLDRFSNKIPKVFHKFVRQQSGYFGSPSQTDSLEDILGRFLAVPDRNVELWVHTGNGPVQAKWQPKRRVSLKLKLDLKGKAVDVRRLAFSEAGGSVPLFARIGKALFFDLSSGVLSPCPNLRSWKYADFLDIRKNPGSEKEMDFFDEEDWDDDDYADVDDEDRDCSDDTQSFPLDSSPFRILAEDFNQKYFVLIFKQDFNLQEEIVFSIEGTDAQSLQIPCRFRLSLLRDNADPLRMTLVLEGLLEDFRFSFQGHPLLQAFRFHRAEDRGLLFLKERDKDFIRQGMAHLILNGEMGAAQQGKIIRETEKKIFDKNFGRRRSVGPYLKSFCQFLEEVKESTQCFVSSGQWILGKISAAEPLAAFCFSYLFFGKETVGLCGNWSALVSKRKVLKNLLTLKTELERRNIEFYFDKKAVHVSNLDFALDATRKAEGGWFEIHPEIKLNHQALSRSEWALLSQDGFLVKDDVVEVVDANSGALLAKLDRFLKNREPFSKVYREEYVRVPPLEIFDWVVLRKLGLAVKLSPEDEEQVNRLLRFRKLPARKLPLRFQGTLRDYQKEGYDWLAFLYEHRFGACLADDMGLGKTVQALAFLAGLKESKINAEVEAGDKPHLIVMPSSLVFNWEFEIKRFYPDFKVALHVGADRSCDFKGADIVLTTYDLLRRDIEQMKDKAFHVILFDEAQMIKNLFSARTSAVRSLKGEFKMAMTGTPFENHLGEYYSVMDLCLPGLFGEYEHFRAQVKEDDFGFLTHRTRPFVLRRTKEKILKELPPKVESDIYLSLTLKQKGLYQKTVEEVRGNIEKAYREKTEAQARVMALTGMLRLRQICISPELVQPNRQERSPKMEHLITKLHELKDEGHAALVFSQFTSFLDLLERELNHEKITLCRLDGQTPLQKRRERVETFQKKDGPPVFLISLKAGGFGLNLTRANYVFHLDPWWNPAVDRQASDRAHRIGQEKTVIVQRILMRHTIEEKVMALRNTKWELFQAVMNEDAGGFRGGSLSRSDFEFLLS